MNKELAMNNELERRWRKGIVIYFNDYCCGCSKPGGLSVRISGHPGNFEFETLGINSTLLLLVSEVAGNRQREIFCIQESVNPLILRYLLAEGFCSVTICIWHNFVLF
jgi:hypothetical protein